MSFKVDAVLELKPEKVGPYLKYITEAVLETSENQGSFRKAVWEFMMNKYKDRIDYTEFLVAIRRFINEGKVVNKDGFYTIPDAIIEEVKEQGNPTPAFSRLYGQADRREGVASAKRQSAKMSVGVGKKSGAKSEKHSAKQSTIQKYFMRKQMDPFDFRCESSSQQAPARGLGFATPPGAGYSMNRPDLSELRASLEKARIEQERIEQQHPHLIRMKTPPKTVTIAYSEGRNLLSGSGGGIHGKQGRAGAVSQKPTVVKKTKAIQKPVIKPVPKNVGRTTKTGIKPFSTAARAKASAPHPAYHKSNSDAIFSELRSLSIQPAAIIKPAGSKTAVNAKSKAIKKKEPKPKVVSPKKESKKKCPRKGLRGKTLDLKKMGVIRGKKQAQQGGPIIFIENLTNSTFY